MLLMHRRSLAGGLPNTQKVRPSSGVFQRKISIQKVTPKPKTLRKKVSKMKMRLGGN